MKLNLRNPLVIFDLETTGTHIIHDRIVEISMVRVEVNNETKVKTLRLNPTIPIPTESSLIHGIYDEDIKDAPTFKQAAHQIFDFLKGADLGGFNVVKFDIPVLVEEFLRAEMDFDITKKKIIDAQKIFHIMEKRNLSAAYKFYCDQNLENAHSAEADTLATFDVLKAQIERYENEDVFDMLGNKVGVIQNDMSSLNEITNYNLFDVAGRMIFNKEGVVVFNFGKNRGRSVKEVLTEEPQYYDWVMKGDFAMDTKRKLTKLKIELDTGKL